MEIFVVSDVHGHYTEFKKAVDESGFIENSKEHLLVCLGDYFDRGCENRRVLEYFERLKNAVLLRGNHEDMLRDVIMKAKMEDRHFLNGTDATITEFFGKYAIDPVDNSIDFGGKNRDADRIIEFIDKTRDYFETEHYIFVHGWLCENYKTAASEDWRRARFKRWIDYIDEERKTGKTIVCGHLPTLYARLVDKNREIGDSGIFHFNNAIMIDAATASTGRVNILKINDDCLTPNEE